MGRLGIACGLGAVATLASWLGCAEVLGVEDWGGAGGQPAASSSSASASSSASSGQGGEADAGAVPRALAQGICVPVELTLDASYVYWTAGGPSPEEGSVQRVPKTGGAVQTLADKQPAPTGLAVDDTSVYWGNEGSGQVMTAPIEPDAGTINAIVNGAAFVGAVAVDATYVYWATLGGNVARIPKTGGPEEPIAMAELNPARLVLANGRAFWTNVNIENPTEGSVRTALVDGGALSTLAISQQKPWSLAVYDDVVYWANQLGPTPVASVSVSGGIEISLQLDIGDPRGLAVDASGIYVTSHSTNTLLRAPLRGETTEVLAESPGPGPVALDQANVYWLSTGEKICDGTLFALPK